MKNKMLSLGAYLYLNELPDLLQTFLQDQCCYNVDNRPFYCIDDLGSIDSDYTFTFFVTTEDNEANNYLGLGTDIISVTINGIDRDLCDIINALEQLRHIIKLRVAESISESIKIEQYITCWD